MLKEKYFIGDLHGNKDALIKNLGKFNLIDKNFNWKGGNSDLYLLGDIIGDREKQGLEILLEIYKIKTQVEGIGGNFGLIAGNHEDYVFSFLGNSNIAGNYNTIATINNSNQGLGVEELITYFSDKNYKINDLIGLGDENLKKLRNEILYNLNNSKVGIIILETLLDYKLVLQSDNLLINHTNTTTNIVNLLNRYNFDYDLINSIYQNGLKDILTNNKKPKKEYYQVRDIFLNTNNRSYFWKEQSEILKNKGIEIVIHGHTNNRGYNDEIGGVKIYSADTSFGKPNTYMKMPEAIIKIDNNGELILPTLISNQKINWSF